MKINKEVLFQTCKVLLQHYGAPPSIAQKVVEDLFYNEYQGYSSHGVLRIPEYIREIDNKNILPKNKPQSSRYSSNVTKVDGQKGFGCLSKEKVTSLLMSYLQKGDVGVVSLVNSGHFGRLGNIVAPVSQKGGIVIGFSNFSGSGQNVPPFGGTQGRLCTNPIVISVPGPSLDPLVLDMSTTNVAEGKVREAYLNGQKVPKGWLIDKDWMHITDPKKFYEAPKTAFLCPLGSLNFGYKGFGLGLMTDILAGILTGGGFSRERPIFRGNSAFFIVIPCEIFGRSLNLFQKDLQELLSYISSCPPAKGFKNIKIPGLDTSRIEQEKTKTELIIPKILWQEMCNFIKQNQLKLKKSG